MTTQTSRLPFDLSAAMNHLTAKDEKLAELITATLPFQMDADPLQSPMKPSSNPSPINPSPEKLPPLSLAALKP